MSVRGILSGAFVIALLLQFSACGKISGLDDLVIGHGSDAGGDQLLDSSMAGSSGTGGSGTGGSGAGGVNSGGTATSGSGPGGGTGTGGIAATGGTNGTGAAGGSGGGISGSGGSLPDASAADGSTSACPGTAGPAMIAGDGFCVDSTEVTNAQYAAFWQAAVSDAAVVSQPTECQWNTTIVPTASWPPASNELNQPVVYVDWCDAYAFCAWAGKRLCGNLAGGSVPYDQYADKDVSQWMRACVSNAFNTYPYGGTYVNTACNTEESIGAAWTVDVGTMPDCHGFDVYASVYDMSGNVLEWEDSCEPDPSGMGPGTDICRIRGGSKLTNVASTCDYDDYDPRSATAPLLGFRCCADL